MASKSSSNGLSEPTRKRKTQATTGNQTIERDLNKNLKKSSHYVAKNEHFLPREMVAKIVWEPGIRTGYRPMEKPWFYYLRSLFRIHNETGNVWTHLVAPVFFMGILYRVRGQVDFANNPSAHGLLVGAVGTGLQMICSAMAHLLHSKSETTHYLLFCIDYMGIALYSCSHGMMAFYCSGNDFFYDTLGPYFPWIMISVATSCTLGNSAARTLYWKPCLTKKLLQITPCFLSFFCCQIPVLFRVYQCWDSPNCVEYVNNSHTISWGLVLINGPIFSLHQPERSFPGTFDIWGHSHQWFHIILVLGTMSVIHASYQDLLVIPKEVLLKANPSVTTLWTTCLFVVLLNMGIVVVFYNIYKRRPVKAEE